MIEEVILGDRVITLKCEDKKSCEIKEKFLFFILKKKEELLKIMDEYKVPEQIILNLKKGSGELDGKYYLQKKSVRSHLIVIDIYTKNMKKSDPLDNLIDTFIHEIIHNRIENDKETRKITKKLLKNVIGNKVYK